MNPEYLWILKINYFNWSIKKEKKEKEWFDYASAYNKPIALL